MDTELIIKAVSSVIAAASLFFTVRNQVRRSRQALKLDLEIMNLLKDSSMRVLVEEGIRTRITRLYGKPDAGEGTKRIHDLRMLVFGCVTLTGFAVWTIYLNRDGFDWWSVVTGFFAFGGLANIIQSLQPPRKLEDKKPKSS